MAHIHRQSIGHKSDKQSTSAIRTSNYQGLPRLFCNFIPASLWKPLECKNYYIILSFISLFSFLFQFLTLQFSFRLIFTHTRPAHPIFFSPRFFNHRAPHLTSPHLTFSRSTLFPFPSIHLSIFINYFKQNTRIIFSLFPYFPRFFKIFFRVVSSLF